VQSWRASTISAIRNLSLLASNNSLYAIRISCVNSDMRSVSLTRVTACLKAAGRGERGEGGVRRK
jgi:hypothetical protein